MAAKKLQHEGLLAAVAHQAEAPDLVFKRAESPGDFDVEFFEQLVAEFRVVDACRNHDRGDGHQAVFRIFYQKF